MILIRFLLLIIFRENFNVNMLRDCGIVLELCVMNYDKYFKERLVNSC